MSHHPNAPFAVHYADLPAARRLLTNAQNSLGVIGFGAARPDFLAPSCPFIAAPLTAANGEPAFEIWTASSPTTLFTHGPVSGACSDTVAFGAIALDEHSTTTLEATVEKAYLAIFDFLEATNFPTPIRFWNYLTAITADEDGMERYRRFNIGRHHAFAARLRQAVPPAASGVGGNHGQSIIYFLAAREPARVIENPRQISAYDYPEIYGPRSPSFSRASLYKDGDAQSLFISGTASIVGHETRHIGDLQGQIMETGENLRALIAAAGAPTDLRWASKIYLLSPEFQITAEPLIDTIFGANSERVYLHGDICRPDLLIEIEAFGQS